MVRFLWEYSTSFNFTDEKLATASLPVAVLNGTSTLGTAVVPTGTGLPPFANATSSGPVPPFANTTSNAGVGLTTLTISVTSVSTIISCAATVTNCPAATDTSALTSLPEGAVSTILVTNVIDITTTVCPVTEVPAISSSVLASFSATASLPAVTTTSTLIVGDASSTADVGATGGGNTGVDVPSATSSAGAAGTTASLETSATVPGSGPSESVVTVTLSNTVLTSTVSKNFFSPPRKTANFPFFQGDQRYLGLFSRSISYYHDCGLGL